MTRGRYYDQGVDAYWLDETDGEGTDKGYDQYAGGYATQLGPKAFSSNLWVNQYLSIFAAPVAAAGSQPPLLLTRGVWAGGQRHGVVLWSSDIQSNFETLAAMVPQGVHASMSGIPWWTTDIGGFHGGDPNDEAFRELFVRWFQWGAFCPVMRLHGDREPKQPQHGTTGGATCLSGAANEVWSYEEEVYGICKKYMFIREEMREYTRSLMKEAHEKGTPVMRPLFYSFPEDKKCWEVEDQYMFGEKYLCCPVLAAGLRKREVYLPKGRGWTSWDGEKKYEGGQVIEADCPIDTMPVFVGQ